MHIGKRIEEVVKQKGMSVVEISEAIGKTRQTVYDLYEKPHVSTDILEKLSKKLDIPLVYFFTDLPGDITSATPASKPQHSNPDIHEWLADRNKIIQLQSKELHFEKSKVAFAAFIENLREDIIRKNSYRKRLSGKEEKEAIKDTSFDEVSIISAEDNQKAYNEIFRLYPDFGIFFETGLLTNPYWKEAWNRYVAK